MIRELSILIPTYNDDCSNLVSNLLRQATLLSELKYEIIVGDDGSTDQAVVERNRNACSSDTCRYLRSELNMGRSAIRNRLALEARYEWLLFIDSGIELGSESFLSNYLACDHQPVTAGGVTVSQKTANNDLLRYRYEHSAAQRLTAKHRSEAPHKCFRTSNFMVLRTTMLTHPLPEYVKGYGYEDVIFGKTLAENHVGIIHIDNPVVYTRFETNPIYINKVEESMRTLHRHRAVLEGYSPVLDTAMRLKRLHIDWLARLAYRYLGRLIRQSLCTGKPALRVLSLYKLLYFSHLEAEKTKKNSQ